MSAEAARQFVQKLGDAQYRATVQSAIGAYPDDATVIGYASKTGYNFTEDELLQSLNVLRGAELTDRELSAVAGGLNPQPKPPRINLFEWWGMP